MKRFMIGQHGKYDQLKQQRDFRDNFYGVEACLFENEEDIDKLLLDSRKNDYKICVHFPFRAGKWRLRDAQFLSKDLDIKKQSYDYIKGELEYISHIGAEYVLFHYPKPVLLDRSIDWSNWRFADETEYCYDDTYSYKEFLAQSEEFFKFLSDESEKLKFTPVLEFDALNKYIYENNGLKDLLNKYKKIKVCLDLARLHLQDKIDEKFNGCDIARQYARYAEVIHLSNGRIKDNLESNHYPALRTLRPEDGWADIGAYLKIINEENNDCKIFFEHRSDLISDEQLEDCYRWIRELLIP
jgi:sugar phosphate isomerase/epimerase